MAGSKKFSKKTFLGSILVGLLVLIPVTCSFLLQPSGKMVRVALKTDSGLFFLSNTDGDGNRYFLSKGVLPVQKWVQLVKTSGEYYISTSDIKDYAALFALKQEFYPYDGGDHQGVFSPSEQDFFTLTYKMRPSSRIGIQERRSDVHIVSQLNGRSYNISWWNNSEPVENCEIKRVWVDRSYKPNSRTLALEKELLVNLTDLAQGLGVNPTFDYSAKDKVLYIEM